MNGPICFFRIMCKYKFQYYMERVHENLISGNLIALKNEYFC